jgi:hypothetical protein
MNIYAIIILMNYSGFLYNTKVSFYVKCTIFFLQHTPCGIDAGKTLPAEECYFRGSRV